MRGHGSKKLPNWTIGLIAVVILAMASYFAYTKQLPWHHGYQIKAVFSSAQNLAVKSQVRIAGVEVGEVTDVQPLTSSSPEFQASTNSQAPPGSGGPTGQQAAVVTMEISDEGRPIHQDATFTLRPRLFLEGNLFVDLKPGSPESPEADADYTFPINQTAYSVQLDQVLSTLQSDVRSDLQTFLDQFGNALIKYNGAQGFQDLYSGSAGAYKFGSEVNDALLGQQPHDLSGLIRNFDVVIRALDRNESQLQGLVSNFRTVTGSFAAQDQALQRAIGELPNVLDAARPAFANLNDAFPPLRAFAREALPGVRSTGPMIDASIPFIDQLRHLVSKPELRGLVHDLRPTIPDLAKLSKRSIPFLNQSRALSSCFNEVIIPWSNDTVDPQDPAYSSNAHLAPHGTVAEETAYGLLGIGGESQGGDANGQTIRVEAGGGPNTVVMPGTGTEFGEQAAGIAPGQILGAMPKVFPSSGNTSTADSVQPPLNPKAPCERQQPPDLGALGGPGPSGQQTMSTAVTQDQLRQALSKLDQSKLSDQAKQLNQLQAKKNPTAPELKAIGQLEKQIRGTLGIKGVPDVTGITGGSGG
jgi:phospholipid/cholesterol/gamma-HCH transport system substrate-binding protein